MLSTLSSGTTARNIRRVGSGHRTTGRGGPAELLTNILGCAVKTPCGSGRLTNVTGSAWCTVKTHPQICATEANAMGWLNELMRDLDPDRLFASNEERSLAGRRGPGRAGSRPAEPWPYELRGSPANAGSPPAGFVPGNAAETVRLAERNGRATWIRTGCSLPTRSAPGRTAVAIRPSGKAARQSRAAELSKPPQQPRRPAARPRTRADRCRTKPCWRWRSSAADYCPSS